MTSDQTIDGALGRSTEPTQVLRAMHTIRSFEERVLELRRSDAIAGSVHLCVGQEIAPVAVSAFLTEADRVLSTYRGHGWALAAGVPPDQVFGELLGREGGTNGGRGGSPYLSAPAYGFLGENSIVAASMPIANGVAMALEAQGHGGIAVVSVGDGATNQGAAHEALVFARARGLPVLFVCENNSWSEMTPISSTAPGVELFERVGAGGMTTAKVDGSDVAATLEAAKVAVDAVRSGRAPYFLEITVPRIQGHYNADIEHYRSPEDKEEHARRDPLMALRRAIVELGIANDGELDQIAAEAAAVVARAESAALAMPHPDPATARDHVTAAREAIPSALAPVRPGKEMKYGLAVNQALATELADRPEVVLFGEDIAIPGGTFGVTRNLRKQFGERVFDTPISESAILGAAVGASMQGLRPVVEIMWSDFLFVAFDQVINQAANVRYVSRGQLTAPLVIRMQQGITPGSCAQHSQSIEALLAHIPGIKVGVPATPADAYAMTRAAIADDDPVVIIESRRLYLDAGPVDLEAPVEEVGGARQLRDGGDLLIITWGTMVQTALAAADRLAEEGISASVLDLRWISPLDTAAIFEQFSRNGQRAIILHEANLTGGFGAEVAALLAEKFAGQGPCWVRRIGLPDVRVPAASGLQEALIPGVDRVLEAAAQFALERI